MTFPAAVTSRTLTLTGTNTGLNTLTPIIPNNATIPTALAKTGTGTWALTGNNTYSAGTTVAAGTLMVNGQTGTNSGTGTGTVTVNGGTFAGSGRAAGAVTVNDTATLQGGTGGSVTATNTLSLGSTLTTDGQVRLRTVFDDVSIDGNVNPQASLIAVTGAFDKNTGGVADLISVHLVGVEGTYEFGLPYTLTVATLAGGTTTLALSDFTIDTPEGFTYSGTPTLVLNANDLQINFVPVPEPTTVLGLGVLGLAAARLRRRRVSGK